MQKIILSFLLMIFTVQLHAQNNHKNILVIISDDHAYQSIGAYGAKFNASPQLDKLASQGAVFENAFVTNSICGYSQAAHYKGLPGRG